MAFETAVLSGRIVRLEPLTAAHVDGLLAAAAASPGAFPWIIGMDTPERQRAWIENGIAEGARGVSVPFATIFQKTGEVIGTSRFSMLSPENKRAEIGWTWLGRPWQRTGANREAKLLMLRQAFEIWKLLRVEFKTDSLNVQSRTALAALGATEEGIFRNHMLRPDGSNRHSAYFSILPDEFPAIAARIEAALPTGEP
ncbi:GNAT family N-acetyltransferase [Lacibacterium aquatile]|uniref:GNAT family N-acetyltransferase n=1 Tax=Lacibacterium aquatile TaxID=1168082 RepID=A0ABW5DMU8_9PROT